MIILNYLYLIIDDGIVIRTNIAEVEFRNTTIALAGKSTKREDLVGLPKAHTITVIGRPIVVGGAIAPGAERGAGETSPGNESLETGGEDGAPPHLEVQALVQRRPERQVARRRVLRRAVAEERVPVASRIRQAGAASLGGPRDGERVQVPVAVRVDAARVGVVQRLRPRRRALPVLRPDLRAHGEAPRHRDVVLEGLVAARGVLRHGLRERDAGRRRGAARRRVPQGPGRDRVRVLVEPQEDLARHVPGAVRRRGEGGARGAVVVETDDLDRERVLVPVAEERQPRRDVDLLLPQVEGLDADDGAVEVRDHAPGVYHRVRPGHPRELAVDQDLHLPPGRVSGVRAVACLERVDGALGHVAPPELLVALALDVHGKHGAVHVPRQGDGVRSVLLRDRELAGLPRGARPLGNGDDQVRWCLAGRSRLEEGRRERRVEETGVDVVDDILQVEDDGLRLPPQRQEGRHVLLPDPADAVRSRLRRRGPPHLRVPQVHHPRPIVLSALHEHREIHDYVVKVTIGGNVVALTGVSYRLLFLD